MYSQHLQNDKTKLFYQLERRVTQYSRFIKEKQSSICMHGNDEI